MKNTIQGDRQLIERKIAELTTEIHNMSSEPSWVFRFSEDACQPEHTTYLEWLRYVCLPNIWINLHLRQVPLDLKPLILEVARECQDEHLRQKIIQKLIELDALL